MRNHIRPIRLVLSALCLSWVVLFHFTSCETIDNGDLDGFWLITQVDSLQVGASHKIREARMSWSFQAHLARLFNHNVDSKQTPFMMRFEHKDGLLIMTDPIIYNRMDGDVALTIDSVHYLKPHFINSLPDTFHIETLNRTKMKIADDVVRLYFEKY